MFRNQPQVRDGIRGKRTAFCKPLRFRLPTNGLRVGFLLAWVVVASGHMRGQGQPDASTDTARDAWQAMPEVPWYDAEKDRIRSLPLPPRSPPPSATTWTSTRSTSPPTATAPLVQATPSGSEYIPYAILVVLLVVVLFLLVRSLQLPSSIANRGRGQGSDARTFTPALLRELPFDLPPDENDPLAMADRHAQRGEYGEAIVRVFAYLLVTLHQRDKIHLASHKTNRMYARELERRTALRRLFLARARDFEDYFFGAHGITAERYQTARRTLEGLDALLTDEVAHV